MRDADFVSQAIEQALTAAASAGHLPIRGSLRWRWTNRKDGALHITIVEGRGETDVRLVASYLITGGTTIIEAGDNS